MISRMSPFDAAKVIAGTGRLVRNWVSGNLSKLPAANDVLETLVSHAEELSVCMRCAFLADSCWELALLDFYHPDFFRHVARQVVRCLEYEPLDDPHNLSFLQVKTLSCHFPMLLLAYDRLDKPAYHDMLTTGDRVLSMPGMPRLLDDWGLCAVNIVYGVWYPGVLGFWYPSELGDIQQKLDEEVTRRGLSEDDLFRSLQGPTMFEAERDKRNE